MGRNENSTEILVHITAPSAAGDDTKYRALALAYLEFEPKGLVNQPQDPSSKPSTVPPEVLVSPQASFGSVWDNVGSPRLAEGNRQLASFSRAQPSTPTASSQLGGDDSQPSWTAPPSEVPDSMPDNDIRVPAFSTPERVLGYFLQSTEPPSISSEGGGGGSVQVQEDGRNATYGNLSCAAPLDSLLGGGTGLDSSPTALGEQIHSRQTQGTVDVVADAGDVTEDCGEDGTRSGLDAATEPQGHATTNLDLLPEIKSASLIDSNDWTHETQLISTEPAVANHRLGPRAPQHLETLAASLDIGTRYKPKYQSRAMIPFERGYWLMRLDGWDFERKVITWGFLGNYIRREGKAGWGTRACRDESWNWIRLYGWEHIAGELYLLLYVASYRKLKYMEMRFYDAAGDVLVVVEPRATRPDPSRG
ncbi:hypothetical protein Daus18300_005103 [Diaporthe australafricana]|uniref:Uncharacterized protein n=1 Tax=Diaporthe australafricana TaxID=127596 RepID=A0ABR3X3Z2_9PEZI